MEIVPVMVFYLFSLSRLLISASGNQILVGTEVS